MEVIECDRCKKRIGEKAKIIPADFSKIKVKREEKLLCAECTVSLDAFLAGAALVAPAGTAPEEGKTDDKV